MGSKMTSLYRFRGKKITLCRRRIYYKVMDLRMFHKISGFSEAFL